MRIYINTLLLFSFHLLFANLAAFAQSSNKKISVPNVVGMTLKEAERRIHAQKWDIGAVVIYDSNAEYSDSSIVIKQNPSAKNAKGTQSFYTKEKLVDLWVMNPTVFIDTLKKPERKRIVVTRDY